MSESKTAHLNEQILSTLDKCILRMSDKLLKTFNPEEKESLTLFKQFCSALNARRQWLKSVNEDDEKLGEKMDRVKRLLNQKSMKAVTSPTDISSLLNAPVANSPLRPKDLQNGLVCNR